MLTVCFENVSSCIFDVISKSFKNSQNTSVKIVQYRDQVLDLTVKLYAVAVGPAFIIMDGNARLHRVVIVKDCLENEDIASMKWPENSPDLNSIESLRGPQSYCVEIFLTFSHLHRIANYSVVKIKITWFYGDLSSHRKQSHRL